MLQLNAGGGAMNSPLAYIGGKSKLANTIIDMMPEHKAYCEVFAGAAWVFFKKPISKYEVIDMPIIKGITGQLHGAEKTSHQIPKYRTQPIRGLFFPIHRIAGPSRPFNRIGHRNDKKRRFGYEKSCKGCCLSGVGGTGRSILGN
jgi:hypothetical protein